MQHDPSIVHHLITRRKLNSQALVDLLSKEDDDIKGTVLYWVRDAIEFYPSNFVASPQLMKMLVDISMPTLGKIANKQPIPKEVIQLALQKMSNAFVLPLWLKTQAKKHNLQIPA
jgi:hypothetical protein